MGFIANWTVSKMALAESLDGLGLPVYISCSAGSCCRIIYVELKDAARSHPPGGNLYRILFGLWAHRELSSLSTLVKEEP